MSQNKLLPKEASFPIKKRGGLEGVFQVCVYIFESFYETGALGLQRLMRCIRHKKCVKVCLQKLKLFIQVFLFT